MRKMVKESMLNVLHGLVFGLAVWVLVVPAQVAAVTLDDLITNGGSIREGDKLFHNFFYVDVNGNGPSAADINVSGDTTAGFHGLEFQGGFVDFPGPPPVELFIGYSVDVLDPTKEISDIHVAANLAVFGTGTSSLTVWADDPDLGSVPIPPGDADCLAVHLGCVKLTNPPQFLSDSAVFPYSVPSADIVNQIKLDGGKAGFATLSFTNNWLSQVSVPEPTVLLLVGSGLLGIVCVSRKGRFSR